MSAGRFEWEATRFEHVDAESGARLVVRDSGYGSWSWKVDGVRIPPSDGSGVVNSSSAAKGAARKALAAHLAKAVRS